MTRAYILKTVNIFCPEGSAITFSYCLKLHDIWKNNSHYITLICIALL